MKTKRKASDKMSKRLLNNGKTVRPASISPCSHRTIFNDWMQDEQERQLRLLSQRHEVQGQIAAHNQQIIQYQQQIEQRQQQRLTALAGYALTLPQEKMKKRAGWRRVSESEAQSWQQRQNELTALQIRMQQLTPILETLPQSDERAQRRNCGAGKLAAGS